MSSPSPSAEDTTPPPSPPTWYPRGSKGTGERPACCQVHSWRVRRAHGHGARTNKVTDRTLRWYAVVRCSTL
jgi:hypothetical protein